MVFNYDFFIHKLILIIRRGEMLYFLLFFFIFLITLLLGVLLMNGDSGSTSNPSPSTRGASNDMGGTGGKGNNKNNFSGFDSTNRENSSEKNKKTKHSHAPIDSSFSQFPEHIRPQLERRSRNYIFAKSSINHKKSELEIAKLKARVKPLSKDEELCKTFSDKCWLTFDQNPPGRDGDGSCV